MASVKELKAIVEGKRDAREAYERLHKALEARATEIRESPAHVRIRFWCDECALDFEGEGNKEVRAPKNDIFFAFYRGYCPEGHVAIRRITDRLLDPYFYRSTFVRREQLMHADDMLTPRDPRFKALYPEAWQQIKEREEAGMEAVGKR